MKIIFFGTSEFAVGPLKALLNSRHDIACVVTQPRRKKGRGLKLAKSPVEEFAVSKSLTVLELDDVNSVNAIETLKNKNADLFIVAAFGQILKKQTLEIPGLYSINIHASLLPQYRGASPIQRAILNGDQKTGITIMLMNEFLDKGDIISKKEIRIEPEDDAIKLSQKLSKCASELILKTVEKIDAGSIKPAAQDEAQATYAPKLVKEDGLIAWDRPAQDIINKIRACKPWPSAYTYINKQLLKIHDAQKIPSPLKNEALPGEVMIARGDELVVACRRSCIKVNKLQLEGRRSLDTGEFLRGYNIEQAIVLG